jgi:hypothetical protein
MTESDRPARRGERLAVSGFAQCMASHGVTNFPDPGAQGGLNIGGTGINLLVPKTISPTAPRFEQAAKACDRWDALMRP